MYDESAILSRIESRYYEAPEWLDPPQEGQQQEEEEGFIEINKINPQGGKP